MLPLWDCVKVSLAVSDLVRVADAVPVALRVPEELSERVPDRVCVPLGLSAWLADCVDDCVRLSDGVMERV